MSKLLPESSLIQPNSIYAKFLQASLTRVGSSLTLPNRQLLVQIFVCFQRGEDIWDSSAFFALQESLGAYDSREVLYQAFEAAQAMAVADKLNQPFKPHPPDVRGESPAPRLVGVETNPGPPRSGLAPTIGEAAAMLGVAAAKASRKTKRGKAKKKKKTSKIPPSLGRGPRAPTSTSSTSVFGTGIGTVERFLPNIDRPNRVSNYAFSVGFFTDADGNPVINTNNGASISNIMNVNAATSGSTAYNSAFFPPQVRTEAQNYAQYRVTKLVAEFLPVTTTNAATTILYAVSPETYTTGTTPIPAVAIRNIRAHAGFPIWEPKVENRRLNMLGPGGLSKDWRYIDFTPNAAEAQQREEAVGAFVWSYLGAPVTNGYFGDLYIYYEVEFRGPGTASAWTSVPPRPLTKVEESKEETESLTESVYLPSSTLAALGLQRSK